MLDQLIYELDSSQHDPDSRPDRSAAELRAEVFYLAQQRFWQYTPAQLIPFEQRLVSWLLNASLLKEDLRTMLEAASMLQFVDREDLAGLYRGAFRGPIMRWLVEQEQWSLETMMTASDEDWNTLVGETWFCPITDSMDIGQFLRINGIARNFRRPAWKSLVHFGDFDTVREFVNTQGYKRLVLLEDFVGTGTQALSPVVRALDELNLQTLFVPLTTSELSIKKFARLERDYFPRFSYSPVYVVPRHVHVFQKSQPGEPELFGRIRDLAMRTFPVVKEPMQRETDPPRWPLGFNRTCGVLFIQYTNCPNNTVPFIWHDAPEWCALFPRVPRQ